MKTKAPPLKEFNDKIFQERLSERYEELYNYYNTIYHNDQMFDSLINMIFDFYQKRPDSFKKLDLERLKNPKWFCKNDSIGIQFYIEKVSDNLRDLESKLDYLQKLGIKFVYALPFLDTPPSKSDAGFAVSNYRQIRKDLGTIEDLKHLINTLHERNMCFCMNFVINHTSDEHEWAQRAKKGEIEYQNRYYFFDSWYIPNKYDSYTQLSHFFGEVAPDNFTYVPECQKIVMTTFYPFQWDLNFRNPVVFNETMANILYLMNIGVDVLLFNGTPCLWKKPGTSCRMLNQSYIINYLIVKIMEIVCPGVAAWIDLKQKSKSKNIDLKEDSYVDESESETENEFIVTESGVMMNDGNHDLIEMSIIKSTLEENEEEEENVIEFDQSKEVGSVHYSYPWISRLWASLALNDVHSIIKSINSICNRFPSKSFFTRVQSHDDINWGNGFDSESSSLIGQGLGNSDGFYGDIITLYRYLNDFYTGNMPGSYSKGLLFAEDLTTGKARICGRTASLLGLETALEKRSGIMKKIENAKQNHLNTLHNKLKMVDNCIQNSIDQILLLHSVSASMPSMFIIYYGDEIGQLNDYSESNYINNVKDTRFVLRGKFDWESANVVEKDINSYQAKIFNGIKEIINARLNCPSFTENIKTVFINSYSYNQYFDDDEYNNMEYEVDPGVLIFKRIQENEKFLLFIFNFCKYPKLIHIQSEDVSGKFKDMITGQVFDQINNIKVKGYGYLWLEPIIE